jgi:hypothetical protein
LVRLTEEWNVHSHVDITHRVRFERVGHQIAGNPQKGSSPGENNEKVNIKNLKQHLQVYNRVLANEKGTSTMTFLSRAVVWFNGHGIEYTRLLSDNGST